MGLPGVGVKTAFCTLSFSFGMPVFPMDTHILRVFARLGVIPQRHNVEREHFRITGLVETGRHCEFHLNVITLGRKVCKAGRPQCGQCPVNDMCDWFSSKAQENGR
jgi:endonuclease-3